VFFLFQLKSVDFQQFNFIARGRHSVSFFENYNTVFELGGIDWIELHSAEIKTCQMGVVGFDASLHSRLGSGVTLHNEKNKTQADMQYNFLSDQKSRGKYFHVLWIFSNLMEKRTFWLFLNQILNLSSLWLLFKEKTAIDKKMGGISKSRGKYFHLLWIFSNLMIKKKILAFLKSNQKNGWNLKITYNSRYI